jgi:hypothetical protein
VSQRRSGPLWTTVVGPVTGLRTPTITSYWAPLILALGALVIWTRSVRLIDLRALSDIGVFTLVTPAAFLAVGVLSASFCLALRPERPRRAVLLVHVVALIVLVMGIPSLVDGTPFRPDAWRHVGIAEYIARNGSVDPNLNAYFGWPSFFILSAFVTELLGLGRPTDLAVWAPIFFNLLNIGPLLLILRSSTRSQRLPWLALWLFYLTDWVGQDYYAPQALAYLFHLTVLGVLLRWFSTCPVPLASGIRTLLQKLPGAWAVTPPHCPPTERSGTPDKLGLLFVVFLAFSVIVSGHQLTPFVSLVSVAALVVLRLCPMRGLLIAMTVMVAGWILYQGWAFFSGHLLAVINNIGRLDQDLNTTVSDRVTGSPGHIFVVHMRLVASLTLWMLASIGAVLRLRRGYQDFSIAVLAVAPFWLLPVETYGGEMVIRVYLFALPAVAFFVATFLFGEADHPTSWLKAMAITLLSMGLFAVLLITRYGDARVNHMTVDEIAAVQYVYNVATPGSLLVAAGPNTSWQFQDMEKYRYAEFDVRSVEDREALREGDGAAVERKIDAGGSAPAFLIVTTSQENALEDIGGLPPGTLGRLVTQLTASGRFRAVFSNADAVVLVRSNQPVGARP